MSSPLVSIAMPVFNTIGRLQKGQELLRRAIESLLAQTYKNFELLILDNQSDDGTYEVCQEYALRDRRVKLIRDTQRRLAADGNFELLNHVTGDFVIHGSDDDEWHPQYIEKCIAPYLKGADVDMVYTNFQYIDNDNVLLGPPPIVDDTSFPLQYSAFSSVCRYIVQRTPVPILLGMFKTSVYKSLQPFIEFDHEWAANADNLFIVRFFMRGLRSEYINEPLFFYRARNRVSKEVREPVSYLLRLVRHQYLFKAAILAEMEHPAAKRYSISQQLIIRAATYKAFVYHSLNLLSYILAEEISNISVEDQERIKNIDKIRQVLFGDFGWMADAMSRADCDRFEGNMNYAVASLKLSLELSMRLLELVRCSRFFLIKETPYLDFIVTRLEADIAAEFALLASQVH